MQEQEIHDLVASVLDALKTQQAFPAPSVGQGGRFSAMQSEQRPLTGSGAEPELLAATVDADTGASLEDLGGSAFRKPCGVKEPHNPDVLQEFMRSTGARIGGGACGTRPSTTAYLRFLADHARSKGTVFREVPEEWLRRRGMLAVQTLVEDKDTYLTRPDLGRVLSEASLQTVRERYKPVPQVLIVLSDGLSTDAVLANADEIVPPLTNGLRQAGFTVGDPLFLQMKQHNSAAGVVGRVKKVLRRRYQHQVLLSRVTDTGKLRNIAIAQGFTDFVRLLSGYDAIIQVGGSFFVDLYGVPQFEHALCTFMAKKPLFMIGHSVGPFQDEQFNQLAKYVFGRCDALILRESVSLDLMKRSNITTAKVEHGVDTAWLVDHHTEDFTASYAVQHWLDVAAQQKAVAITLRELAPFDKRLGTTQQAYEKAFAGVVNRILDEGYQVIALSTCTGIDSYNKDDRMVALNLRQHISDPARYHVVMDELNDLEMGKILGACELTVGTRLHSAIISMNFATPAIAINYEHKSAGIMQQLGLPEMAIDIRHLLDGSLQAMVADTLGQLPALNTRLNEAVSRERQTGMQMVKSVLERIGEAK